MSSAVALADGALPATAGPVFSNAGPDADAYGAKLGYPVGLPLRRQAYQVGNYTHYDSFYPSNLIAKASSPSKLNRSGQALDFTYSYQNQTFSLRDYLSRNPTTGLLIARDDTILFEQYQYERTDHDRLMSESMAKTFVSMLVGIALYEHKIRSIDDPAQAYVPELRGSEIGSVSIRALLHMASGIGFSQNYTDTDDNTTLHRSLLSTKGPGPVAAVKQFNTRVAAPDTVFNYASLNTEVLGLIVSRATGTTLSDYLQTRIWQPMGAEADARWVTDNTGQEVASCCLNATLRDYARFGLLLAHGGAFNGKQIIPRQWILDATKPAAPGSFLAFDKGRHPGGYGYQIWLMPGSRGAFALEGVYGQRIFVDPQSGLVLVHTAVRTQATGAPGEAELRALWRGLLTHSAEQGEG
ncbi:serine hydrolase domain-containing protein [Paraburkholderia phenazinium]|uniref:serine hydrolase domain-containing protein n=1 Tax=Paraburkholderia phenazinium TaxID=60549 RepID=UPI00158D44E1|nr:serine hydrolase [Paraburkholderia phenazinium]